MAAAKARNEHSELHAHSEIQAAKEDIDPDAQAHVDANAQGSDVKAYLMDLLNALDMKFDIGRKMASSRSGGRLHVLASYAVWRSQGGSRFAFWVKRLIKSDGAEGRRNVEGSAYGSVSA